MKSFLLSDIQSKIRKSRMICLFGVGALLDDCMPQILLTFGRKPDFLCDNAKEKWGQTFFGIPCISPDELFKISSDVLVVITVKKYESIFNQLKTGGITNVLLLTFDRSYNVIGNIKTLSECQMTSSFDVSSIISLQGKWALVTGASRGVGYQIALAMAKLGVNIIAHSRSLSHTGGVVSKCSKLGVEAISLAADLSDFKHVKRLLDKLERDTPPVDILFNCAGVSLPSPSNLWKIKEDDYLTTYSINTVAPIMFCSYLIPLMIKRGFGRVINVSSSIQYRPAEMAYACSKAALDKYVHDISPMLRDTGVLISLVDPGWLRTDMGGEKAPHPVESVIPGAILGAVLDNYCNGGWFSAQDYEGLSLDAAIQKAKFIFRRNDITE